MPSSLQSQLPKKGLPIATLPKPGVIMMDTNNNALSSSLGLSRDVNLPGVKPVIAAEAAAKLVNGVGVSSKSVEKNVDSTAKRRVTLNTLDTYDAAPSSNNIVSRRSDIAAVKNVVEKQRVLAKENGSDQANFAAVKDVIAKQRLTNTSDDNEVALPSLLGTTPKFSIGSNGSPKKANTFGEKNVKNSIEQEEIRHKKKIVSNGYVSRSSEDELTVNTSSQSLSPPKKLSPKTNSIAKMPISNDIDHHQKHAVSRRLSAEKDASDVVAVKSKSHALLLDLSKLKGQGQGQSSDNDISKPLAQTKKRLSALEPFRNINATMKWNVIQSPSPIGQSDKSKKRPLATTAWSVSPCTAEHHSPAKCQKLDNDNASDRHIIVNGAQDSKSLTNGFGKSVTNSKYVISDEGTGMDKNIKMKNSHTSESISVESAAKVSAVKNVSLTNGYLNGTAANKELNQKLHQLTGSDQHNPLKQTTHMNGVHPNVMGTPV